MCMCVCVQSIPSYLSSNLWISSPAPIPRAHRYGDPLASWRPAEPSAWPRPTRSGPHPPGWWPHGTWRTWEDIWMMIWRMRRRRMMMIIFLEDLKDLEDDWRMTGWLEDIWKMDQWGWEDWEDGDLNILNIIPSAFLIKNEAIYGLKSLQGGTLK